MSASCIKDPRLHPNTCHPRRLQRMPPALPGGPRPQGAAPRASRLPRAAPPRPERGTGLRATGGGGSGSGFGRRRDTMRPGSSAASAAGRSRHKARRRRRPRASRAPPPTDLGLRRQAPAASWSPPSDVAAQQAEQERHRPAHLRAAGPGRRGAGRYHRLRSGASQAVGRRASLHVACSARAEPRRPIGRAPARRGVGPPTAAPPPRAPVGFPEEREPPPRRRRRRLNPFAPPPGEAFARPGPWCHLAARAPTRPPASPPPWVHPALPPNSGGRGRDLGAHTALPFGVTTPRLSGPCPLTWLADGPPKALGSPRVI